MFQQGGHLHVGGPPPQIKLITGEIIKTGRSLFFLSLQLFSDKLLLPKQPHTALAC
jgi:hypothetical protein